MKLEISKADWFRVGKTALAFCGLAVITYILWGFYSSSARASRCEKTCAELKSEIVNGSCVCAAKVGWIKSGEVAQVKQKLEAKPVVHEAHHSKKRRHR